MKIVFVLPDGKVDNRIVHAMRGIDHDRFMCDPELVKVLQDEFDEVIREYLENRCG